MRDQLQRDSAMNLPSTQPICSWIVRHAAWTLTRLQINRARGGTTGFFRVFGQNYSGKVVLMGERVMVMMPQLAEGREPKRASKFHDRWQTGVWLGKAEDSDEHLICVNGTPNKYRIVRRFPEGSEMRKDPDTVMTCEQFLGNLGRSQMCARMWH